MPPCPGGGEAGINIASVMLTTPWRFESFPYSHFQAKKKPGFDFEPGFFNYELSDLFLRRILNGEFQIRKHGVGN